MDEFVALDATARAQSIAHEMATGISPLLPTAFAVPTPRLIAEIELPRQAKVATR